MRNFQKLVFSLLILFSSFVAHAAEITMTVDANHVVKKIEPGAVGWGAMWKEKMMWPAPGSIKTDADHGAYIDRLAREGAPLVKAADMRNISWLWGVSFSTWGVNWENSIKPWSQRPKDCSGILLLNKGTGWCEKSIVGVGDLMGIF